jgi:hypothetical protein
MRHGRCSRTTCSAHRSQRPRSHARADRIRRPWPGAGCITESDVRSGRPYRLPNRAPGSDRGGCLVRLMVLPEPQHQDSTLLYGRRPACARQQWLAGHAAVTSPGSRQREGRVAGEAVAWRRRLARHRSRARFTSPLLGCIRWVSAGSACSSVRHIPGKHPRIGRTSSTWVSCLDYPLRTQVPAETGRRKGSR